MSAKKKPLQQSSIKIGSLGDLVHVPKLYINVPEEVIITTEDKLRLWLLEHGKRMGMKRGWVGPLALFLSLILTLVTTDFKSIGLEAAVWKFIMIVEVIGSFGWLVFSVKEALQARKMEDIISELKKGSKLVIKSEESTELGTGK